MISCLQKRSLIGEILEPALTLQNTQKNSKFRLLIHTLRIVNPLSSGIFISVTHCAQVIMSPSMDSRIVITPDYTLRNEIFTKNIVVDGRSFRESQVFRQFRGRSKFWYKIAF